MNIYDVAKHAGVSLGTVSGVINNSPTVKESTRKKVLASMKELNYTPSTSAQSLAKGKTGIIGLVTLNLHDTFLSNVVTAVYEALEQKGYFLALSIVQRGGDVNEKRSTYYFQEKKIDGILILTPLHEAGNIRELEKRKIPYVLLDNQNPDADAHSVVVNNFNGGYMATKHLIDQGFKKIGHICGPDWYLSSLERERGYLKAMKDAGLTPLQSERGNYVIETGYTQTIKWIRTGILPDAIFAAEDSIAYGAIKALKEHMLKVPDDVAVIGYDNQLYSALLTPPLSTVMQPSHELGYKGVELLLKVIKNKSLEKSKIILEPELIIRESTNNLNSRT